MFHQGRFRPTNFLKYDGDPTNITYRSGWELSLMRWCDNNPFVTSWSSEEIVIPYRCMTDNRIHRYFVDMKIVFESGKVMIIELKPKCQTTPPEKKNKRHKTFLREVLTYTKNVSKWEAAKAWSDAKGYTFAIWTEDDLRKLGVKMVKGANK